MNFHGFDYTYCSSKNCQNKCGRKLVIDLSLTNRLDTQLPNWRERIWSAEFCDENGDVIDLVTTEDCGGE